ncbi:InlB B-repeat-containing protein [Lysinibacillus sp. RC79]|uniref:InlB B-repeat-containing protein n=1 Tax=Lysinibacillus sp. RC79 TaxID=3156296 RepID=UPI003512FDE7
MKKASLLLMIILLVFSQLSLGNLSVYATNHSENNMMKNENEATNNEDEIVYSNDEEENGNTTLDNNENESVTSNDEGNNEVSDEEEFTTKIVSGGVAITGYKGDSKEISIPDKINGEPVVTIGDYALWKKKLTKVDIPSSVKDIGEYAFAYNELITVDIPTNVTEIKFAAFAYNQLTNVGIPPNMTKIGISAFDHNQLTNVKISSKVTEIGYGAFRANQLTSIKMPSSVATIGEYAFANNQLTNVEIPSSMTEIRMNVFYDNQLTSVKIPSSVTKIREFAFGYNQLINVEIPESVTEIRYGAFVKNKLTSIKIPSSVKEIGDYAFADNQLTNVEIPSSVTAIKEATFAINQLTSIKIPSSVTEIGKVAFAYNQLTNVEIPESVTKIEDDAFYSNSLDFVTFNGLDNFQWPGKYSPFEGQEKEGKTFLGWYEDEGFTKDWDYSVVQPMTIFAKWSLNTVTVTFDANGGSKVPSQSVGSGELVKVPSTPVKEGYTFAGWYKDKGLMEAWNFNQDVVTKDITLYAKWSKGSYIVTFDANGGSKVPFQSVESGKLVKAPSTPVKEGYTFAGWYKDKGLTEAWNFNQDVVTQDITLYAKWSKVSYIVTFDANGGSEVPSQSVGLGELVKVPIASKKEGYIFDGWHKDKELTVPWDLAKDVVTKNVTLYAKWTKDYTSGGGSGGGSSNYKVTFDSNGGSEVPSQTVGYNELVKAPTTPVKDSYQFDGWYKDAELKNVWDFAKDRVTADITLYAKWTKDNVSEGSYIVTFDSNGGSKVPSQTVAYKALVKAPSNPKKEGYTFIGWYKNKDFTKAWDFAKDVVTTDLTLYARWMEESTGCDITFKDIDHNWAQDMIEQIAKRCIIKGYPDGTFRPNDMIQRQHVVLMIERALQPTPIREAVSFSDVPKNYVYYEQITRLQRAGIVDGSNGAFRPNAYITRAQMAKIMVLAFDLTPGGNSTFKDVDSSHWASGYIAALADHNIALGDENGNFRPNENLTRAQFTAFMYRALGL